MGNFANSVKLVDYLLGQQASTSLGRNYVLNPSAFENTVNVAVSGTATVARNTTTPLTNISDFALTLPNNATDGVTWTLGTLDNALNGQNCEMRFDYTASSIGSSVVAQVLQGANIVAQSAALLVTSTAKTVSINAPCGSLASATTLKITNFTGNSGTSAINIANITYGKATNLTTASTSITPWTTSLVVTPSAGFGTVSNQVTETRQVGDSLEVVVNFTIGTVAATTLSIALPTGYVIDSTKLPSNALGTILGYAYVATSGGPATYYSEGFAIFYDGSTTGSVFLASSMQSSTFHKDTGSNLLTSGNPLTARFTVPIVGLTASSQLAINSNTGPTYFSGYMPGSGIVWNTASSTYADPVISSGSNTLTTLYSAGSPVTAAASNVAGITFTPSSTSDVYEITARSTFYVNGGGGIAYAKLTDGTTSLDESQYRTDATNNVVYTFTMTGLYVPTSTSPVTIKIQNKATSLGTGGTTMRMGDIEGSGFASIFWIVRKVVPGQNAPILVGSVTSNSTGAERIERAYITNPSGTATISSQSGSWLTSATRSAAGLVNLVWPSTNWSAAPTCVVSQGPDLGGWAYIATTESTTGVSVRTETPSGGGTNADGGFRIICMGPR